eukprot:5910039-Amphidinium_carterae.2
MTVTSNKMLHLLNSSLSMSMVCRVLGAMSPDVARTSSRVHNGQSWLQAGSRTLAMPSHNSESTASTERVCQGLPSEVDLKGPTTARESQNAADLVKELD